MNKSVIGKIILTLLLICNIGVLSCVGYTSYYQTKFITMLENKIDILAQHQENLVKDVEDMVLTVIKSVIGLEKKDYNFEEDIETLKTYQKQLEEKVDIKKDIDLADVKRIKEANVLIQNLTKQCQGSGTHIKINGEDYVLTCAHLIDEKVEDNNMVIVSDRGTWASATIVKYNQEKDLALLKCPQLKHTAYLEISTEEPREGSEVLVSGNPSGLRDVITDGIVAKMDRKSQHYLITNKIYFGNSGGALLYKGKIVGVMSRIWAFTHNTSMGIITQNYGLAVSLKEIQNFLKEVNYESTKSTTKN